MWEEGGLRCRSLYTSSFVTITRSIAYLYFIIVNTLALHNGTIKDIQWY